MNQQVRNVISIKILVVGNERTGKSSLINHFTTYNPSVNLKPMMGTTFLEKNIIGVDHTMKFAFWLCTSDRIFNPFLQLAAHNTFALISIVDLTIVDEINDIEEFTNKILSLAGKAKQLWMIGNNKGKPSKIDMKQFKAYTSVRGIIYEEIDTFDKTKVLNFFEQVKISTSFETQKSKIQSSEDSAQRYV